MLLKKLGSVLNVNGLRMRKELSHEIKVVKESGLFDSQFYLDMYNDVREHRFWSRNPELHYLVFGASELRKPSQLFDTKWYVENYEDVAQSDINPLLHFIHHGSREGRRTNDRRYNPETKDLRESLKYTIVHHLWGGYSTPALEDLETVYQSEVNPPDVRFFAAWHAARWFYYVSNYEKTLELAELVVSLDDYYKQDKPTAIMYAHSYIGLGKNHEARAICENFLDSHPTDSDMLLTMANVAGSDENRLDIINRIYEPRELSLVRKRRSDLPLSFANITADAKPIESNEKVSVIMPIFNAEDKIEAAITSLLEQSWQNLEIIAVDDRSTDSTFEILKSIEAREPRVRAFRQEVNGGAYLARNRGLKEASGMYITTHDADDWSHPDKIATQVDLLQRKETVMGVCTHWTRALNNLQFTHNWSLNARLIHWNHSSFLFRKKVIEDIGPWDSVIVGGDTEFIWRVQAYYGNGAVVKYKPNIPFSFALDDDGSLTRMKSTHVNTIHHGLRHVYRSAARWWHKTNSELKLEPCSRKFPAPKGMLKRGDTQLECAVVFAANFSSDDIGSEVAREVEALLNDGKQVGLLHWPIYKTKQADLCDMFFELLMRDNVSAIVFGMEVTCQTLLLQSSALVSPMIERNPTITAKAISVLTGDKLTATQESRLRQSLS